MSFRPIDLQTLFSHLNQVGKEQALEKNAALLQQAQQGQSIVRQADQNNHSINQTEKTQEGLDSINEKGHESSGGKKEKEKKESEEKEKADKDFFQDPDVGHNLDITG